MSLIEVNVDGLVGPTHHFGGLGVGNVASHRHAGRMANPRAAALQGLEKMWRLAVLGIPQFFLPPPPRPNRHWLRQLGFGGSLGDQLQRAADEAPQLLAAANSAAGMWLANAATITPSSDSLDQTLHITPANLVSNLHRAMEAGDRQQLLSWFFGRCPATELHPPLPAMLPLRDEGAANHMRLQLPEGALHIFVYGQPQPRSEPRSAAVAAAVPSRPDIGRFPPRQTAWAGEAIARRHQLPANRHVHLQQSPEAIAAGVFHNDVIATSHENVLLVHEQAYAEPELLERHLDRLQEEFSVGGWASHPDHQRLIVRRIERHRLSLEQAVDSYLFNSQLVTPPRRAADRSTRMHLLCPAQCQSQPQVQRLIDQWLADPELPIGSVEYVPLDQSMANGGGPACLRLRLQLTEEQLQGLPSQLRLTALRYQQLREWIERWYPEQLSLDQLADPQQARLGLEAVRQLEIELGLPPQMTGPPF
jgi:succinylarginine dihydrolase